MADSRGVLHDGRDDLTPVKREFAPRTAARTLADALVGADVFLGLSKGGVVTPAMIEPMAPRPIIFALANPDPEIGYDEAKLARPDAIVATGRSDYDNQVNNVLGFPFVFRGALDVRATTISEPMKIAAAQALADLARRDVPQEVSRAYGTEFHFGPSYIIPKPFDPRVLYWVAPAVARAAVESGAATGPFDERAYVEHLRGLLGHSTAVLRKFVRRAATDPRRVVFPEADDPRILEACSILLDEKVAKPVLLGSRELIEGVVRSREIDIDLGRCEIVDPATDPALGDYATSLYEMRQRKGMGRRAAMKLLRDRNYFGLMMVKHGRADAVVTGLLAPYAETIRPMLQIIGLAPGIRRAAGMYLMLHRQRGILCFGDTTVNLHSDAETLADVAELVADAARTFELEPRVAMLSMSNFGSVRHAEAAKVARAVDLLRSRRPDLEVEGELQGNLAVDYALQQRTFPFSRMSGPANVLVFPNLDAGNVAYKLVRELGGVTTVGPVLLGMARAVTVLERDCEVDNIVLMTALTVVEAQELDRRRIAAE